jgi:precorrin-4/cobalt-precorrin-4 C11-methyltransferase
MTVHFIGAGPGAADLITVRGLRLIRCCPVVLYAGSLVPAEVVAEAGADHPGPRRVIDTAPMTLDQVIDAIAAADRDGHDVARVHSGDPSLYGAIAEQMRRLDALGIGFDITPGVPAYAAAAAALETELTVPGISQSIVLTRTAVRASSMPAGEELAAFAATGATLAIHLSINNLAKVVRDLTPILGEACPVAIVHRASWPDQLVIRGTLADIRPKVKAAGITRTALILVGRALAATDFSDSRLYAPDHHHVLRPARASSD